MTALSAVRLSTPLSTDDEILTTEEAADLITVPPATLVDWRHDRKGPRSFKLGRLVRYRRADVDAWLAAQYAATERPRPLRR